MSNKPITKLAMALYGDCAVCGWLGGRKNHDIDLGLICDDCVQHVIRADNLLNYAGAGICRPK